VADEYLTLKQFVVERTSGTVGYSKLELQDMNGQKLLSSVPIKMNIHSIQDATAKEVCRLRHQTIAGGIEINEIYDSTDKLIAKVQNLRFDKATNQHTLLLLDSQGATIAVAIGEIPSLNYTITNPSDVKLATITKKQAAEVEKNVMEGTRQTYQIDIISELPNQLMILEFILAVDYMMPGLKHTGPNAGHPRRPVLSTGGGGSGPLRPGEGGGITL
jgi:hypothetical protein